MDRGRRWAQGHSAGPVLERQRTHGRLLGHAGLAPVAYAAGKGGVKPRQLRRAERDRRVVGSIQRLQLALQDVFHQWSAGDLARRRMRHEPRVGVAQRHVRDFGRKGDIASQVAEVEGLRRFRRDHLRLCTRIVQRRLRRAREQVRQPRVHRQEGFHRHCRDLRRGCGQEPGAVAPHHVVAMVAAVGRLDPGAFRKRAPDVVDALFVVAARIEDRQLPEVRAARHDAAPVRNVERGQVRDGARR